MSSIPQLAFGLSATKPYTSEQLSQMRAIVLANAPYDKLLYRAANMPYREFVHRGPELMSIFDAADLLNIEAFVFAKDGNYTRSLECLQYGASLATQSGPNSSVGVDPYPGFAEYLTNMGFAEEVLLNSRNLLIFAGPNKPVAKAVQRIVDELSPDIDFKTAWIKESASFSQIFRKWRSVPVSKLGDDMQQTLGHEGQVSDDITPTPSEKTLARAALDRAESEYLDNAAAILNGYAESTDRGEKVTNNVESKLGSLKDASSPTSITVLLQYEPLRIMHIGMKRRTAEALITKAAAYALEIKAASGKYPSSLPANLLGHTLNVTIHYSCVGDSQITISSIVQYSKDELKINRPTVKDFVYKQ